MVQAQREQRLRQMGGGNYVAPSYSSQAYKNIVKAYTEAQSDLITDFSSYGKDFVEREFYLAEGRFNLYKLKAEKDGSFTKETDRYSLRLETVGEKDGGNKWYAYVTDKKTGKEGAFDVQQFYDLDYPMKKLDSKKETQYRYFFNQIKVG